MINKVFLGQYAHFTYSEAQEYCIGKGYPITLPGIRYIVKNNDSIFVESARAKKGAPYVVKDELDQYLSLNPHNVYEGFERILLVSIATGVPKSFIYKAVHSKSISYFRSGRGKGILYVKPEEVRLLYNQHKDCNNV